VIASLPILKVEVLKLAVPVEVRGSVPSVVLPVALTWRKVTVPVGASEPVVCETAAVKVTVWPEIAGLGEAVTVVLVAVVPVTVSEAGIGQAAECRRAAVACRTHFRPGDAADRRGPRRST